MRSDHLRFVLSQLDQVLILPLAFLCNGSIGVTSFNTVSYCGCSVKSGSDGVARNVRSRQCLTCGMGGRASSIIFFYVTGCLMSRECSFSYVCHLEHTVTYPRSGCFDCTSGTFVFWVILLKIWQYTLYTIASPYRQYFLVCLSRKFRNLCVQPGLYQPRLFS